MPRLLMLIFQPSSDRKLPTNYRIFRGHPSLLKRMRRNQPHLPRTTLEAFLIVAGQSQEGYNLHCQSNTVKVYDDTTFSEAKFTAIFKQELGMQQVVQSLKLDLGDQLLIHLSQSETTTFSFQNTQTLGRVLEGEAEIATQGQLGLIQSIGKKLYGLLSPDQSIVLSVVGFKENTQMDLLDFKQTNSKIRIVKNKNQTVVQNLIQMVIKDFASFIEVISICSHLKPQSVQAVAYKIHLVRLQRSQEVSIDEILRKIVVVKLFSTVPIYLNSMGSVLGQLSKGCANPLGVRSSKLTTLVDEMLTLDTDIKVITQINPQLQTLKSVINLLNFGGYINRKPTLKKNYTGNPFVIRKLRESRLIGDRQHGSLQPAQFNSIRTQTISSVSKCRLSKYSSTHQKSASNTGKFDLRKIYKFV